jgi:hypothetical protein
MDYGGFGISDDEDWILDNKKAPYWGFWAQYIGAVLIKFKKIII